MRILSVGNMYPPHNLGGYEVINEYVVDHLRRSGHEVEVLATDFRLPDLADVHEPGVHRELRWYWRDHDFPRLPLRERIALERHNMAVLDQHLDSLRPDAVCWWAMGGMSLSLIERANRRALPSVGVVCDLWLLYAATFDGWIRMFSRPALRPLRGPVGRVAGVPTRVDLSQPHWMFISEFVRDLALENGLEPRSSEIAYAGVDPSLFEPSPEREWDWRLLYVGRLDERKGVHLAIDALTLLPAQATLTIVGGGEDAYLARLRSQVSELGLESRVSFSVRPRNELREVYAGGDALLFPVLWAEPWGLVPLEAMSVGTPVIATGSGGSGEYLRHEENCLLFDPTGEAEELAAAVRRLAEDRALRGRLRENGFATAAGFTEQSYAEQVEAALASAVQPR